MSHSTTIQEIHAKINLPNKTLGMRQVIQTSNAENFLFLLEDFGQYSVPE